MSDDFAAANVLWNLVLFYQISRLIMSEVADHCSNLAVDLLRIHENVFDVHEYLEDLKENKDAAFREAYQKDKAVYALPQS